MYSSHVSYNLSLITKEEEVRNHERKGFKLCPRNCWFESCDMTRAFTDSYFRQEKYHDTEAEVKITPRYLTNETNGLTSTLFVVLEAHGIAKGLKDTKVTDSIIRAVKTYKGNQFFENNMYSAMVNNIYDEPLEDEDSLIHNNDYNVLIMGLEKDCYSSLS